MGIKHFSRVWFTVLSLAAAITTGFSVSCTRAVNQTASVSIQLPTSAHSLNAVKAAAAGPQLMHVAINITGAGINAPVFLGWDAHDANATPPATFDLQVPGGSARLVQVLAVYNDGAQTFYYGDVQQDISADTIVSVSVNPFPLPNGGVIQEGSVGGQYLTATGTGPTGSLRVMYKPQTATGAATSKPAMLVFTTSIFNGFFNSFAIGGGTAGFGPVGFNYILDDGTDIFGGVMDVGLYTPPANTPNTAQLKLNIPARWDQNGSGSGPSTYNYRVASNAVFGYFGPLVTSGFAKPVCYSSTSVPLYDSYAPSATPTPSPSPSNGTLTWAGGSTGAANAVTTAAGQGLAASIFAADGQGLCAPNGAPSPVPGRFTNFLSVDEMSVTHDGTTLGFFGPYVAALSSCANCGNNREPLNVTLSGGTLTVAYNYLPGVQAQGMTSDVFFRQIPSNYFNFSDFKDENGGAQCANLTNLSTPNPVPSTGPAISFTMLSATPEVAGSTSQTRIVATLPTPVPSTVPQVIVCPRIGNTYFNTAGVWGNNNGGGSYQPQANALKVVDALNNQLTAATPINILAGTCSPIYIYGLNGTSPVNLYTNPSGINLTFTGAGTAPIYYGGDSTCTITTGQPMPQYASDGTYQGFLVYVKTSTTGTYSMNVTTSGPPSLTFTANVAVVAAPSNIGYTVIPVAASTLSQYLCYPVNLVQAQYNTSAPVYIPGPNPNGTMIQLSGSTPPANLSFYNDKNCTMAISATSTNYTPGTVNIASGNNYYMKYGGTPLPSPTPITFTDSGSAEQSFGTYSGVVVPANPVVGVQISGNNMPTIGSNTMACNQISVRLVDSSGNQTGTGSAINATIAITGSAGGTFYPNGLCSGALGASAPLAFAAGSNGLATVYYMSGVVGTDTLTVTSASFSGGPYTMTINTQPIYSLAFKSAGQSFYTAAGTCTLNPTNTCVTGTASPALAHGVGATITAALYSTTSLAGSMAPYTFVGNLPAFTANITVSGSGPPTGGGLVTITNGISTTFPVSEPTASMSVYPSVNMTSWVNNNTPAPPPNLSGGSPAGLYFP